ncbi:hypothetical protein KL86DES1_21429 [uncultured Desulfovibrio sp.]|uniref:Uncharacterized protein n=1 Tax=uncultured Desulfovibrio sp. TaxID=167968 RepID=A0A212L836_9BACT|nr:hypothetical protein KL86DES1_21429 [uncultured Desulfovibrio sp.]VZH34326.1 conserved protein of unknown function [Desulfovibrio sp. 86]
MPLKKGTRSDIEVLGKRAVISFGKARSFFEAGVDSSVLDCFKKSEATPPNEINQRFLRGVGEETLFQKGFLPHKNLQK